MLTFEKVLEVFQAYLDDDPLYEVVQTSHGYTLMAWEPHRNDWYSAEIQRIIIQICLKHFQNLFKGQHFPHLPFNCKSVP